MLHPQINEVLIETLEDLTCHQFDEVIDVRSPTEFQQDRLPSAINLPVLNDQERHLIGTQYKNEGSYHARKKGSTIISQNISQLIEQHFQLKELGYKPLIYCWRGGQRSGSLAEVCRQIGWQTSVLKGGYKSYRKLVYDYLYTSRLPFKIILLSGHSGTAKTETLKLLSGMGTQVLNLEELANHKGSIFGGIGMNQPSQKMFESQLAGQLVKFDTTKPVLIEAESQKIGRLFIPPSLWQTMKKSKRIMMSATIEDRSAYTVTTYQEIIQSTDGLVDLVERLSPYHSRKCLDNWIQLAKAGEYQELATQLMINHYDPRYGGDSYIDHIKMPDLAPNTIKVAAQKLAKIIAQN